MEEFKEGDILIEKGDGVYGDYIHKIDDKDFVIYKGQSSRELIAGRQIRIIGINRNGHIISGETWGHFYRKATDEEIKHFDKRLDENGWCYDKKHFDFIKKKITDKNELKERLKQYLSIETSYDFYNRKERQCLLYAVDELL